MNSRSVPPKPKRKDTLAKSAKRRNSFTQKLKEMWSSNRSVSAESKQEGDDDASLCPFQQEFKPSSSSRSVDSTVASSSDHSGSQLPPPKVVKFDQTLTMRVFETEDDKTTRWFTPEDNEGIRRNSRLTAFHTMSTNPKHVENVDHAYKTAAYLAANSDENQADAILRDRFTIARSARDLNQSYLDDEDDTCRGLECWVSETQRFDRREVARESRAMVIAMNHLRKQSKSKDDLELIAIQYKERGLSAVMLARFFGESDCAAALRAYRCQTPSAPRRSLAASDSLMNITNEIRRLEV